MRKHFCIVLFLAIACSEAFATQNPEFNYQAKLVTSPGGALSGNHTLFFSLYAGGDAGTVGSGTLLYSESVSLAIADGIVSHAVGTGTQLFMSDLSAATFTADSTIFLQVAVDSPSNVILPRSRIEPTPYALAADNSERIVRTMPVVSGNLVFAGDVVSLLGNSVQKGYSNEVTSGSGAVTFNAAASGSVAVAPLSTTKFVIAYSDGGNASDGTAIVGTVSGGTIAFSGADLAFNAAATDQIAIAALGTSKFVVVYRNIANTKGTAIVGTVSGSTITFGTAVEFSTGAVASPSVTNLDNTHFVVAYTDIATSSVGVAVVGTVTGSTTLSFGSKFAINSASATGISIASVSATKFVAAFDDGANSNQGVFLVGAVSGTDITTGSKSFFNAGQTFGDSIAALSSTRVVVAFGNGAGHGMACIGTISGSSITAGTAFTFHPANSLRISVAPLATDKFVVAYTDDGNASLNGKANVGTINGTAISYSPDFIVGNLVTNNTAVAGLTPTLFVTAFDNATLNHGEANLCALSGTGQTILGVAASSSSGGSVPVILGGVSNVYSGLTPGATYYANGSGTITTTNPALPRVGLALSASEILLKIE